MPGKILIIDDDIDTLKLVGLMLERQGYQISAASSGERGIAKALSDKPDAIVLDVMMPDMDGYEVARRLKRNAATRAIPILMLTAKSQMDDKVTGFEVGADDYLTKPTRLAELQSHLGALLARGQQQPIEGVPRMQQTGRGQLIALLAARGGLGVSTLASNLAAALQVRSQHEVILAELTPGRGTLGLDLGTPNPRGLKELLTGSPAEITLERVGAALVPHRSGLKLLLASENPRDISPPGETGRYEALVECLSALASFVVMDLGSALPPFVQKILPLCDDRIVVTDASPHTISHTRVLLDEIIALGIDPADITIVLNNRVRFEAQSSWTQAQQGLDHPIAATIIPAPELMVAAARRHLPGVVAMPENVTSQQMLKLADKLLLPKKARADGP